MYVFTSNITPENGHGIKSTLYKSLCPKKENVCMLGINAAGKTTILYHLKKRGDNKWSEIITTPL